MGEMGSVGWMFKKRGVLTFDTAGVDEEKLSLEAIEAGADDIVTEGVVIEIYTTPETFPHIRQTLLAKGFKPQQAEVSMIATTTVPVAGDQARKVLNLVGSLEDNDDVQKVHANFDIPDDVLEALE